MKLSGVRQRKIYKYSLASEKVKGDSFLTPSLYILGSERVKLYNQKHLLNYSFDNIVCFEVKNDHCSKFSNLSNWKEA